ncbi:porin [Acidovorax sp.]|uniref:porin n=1 Tax=Acidovorax sp. TaxID=1872122 RepID=UPI00391F827C
MKKSLIALAVLAASGAAMAQSSVTLFGIVDATYAYGSGSVANRSQLTNSGLASSRLGFRGVEDLGGGMSASFHLEAAVNNDDGTGGSTITNNQAATSSGGGLVFNRRSTVSLIGGFGEVRLGRDLTSQFLNLSNFDPFGTNGVGTTQTLNSSIGGPVRVRASNSIGYFLPGKLGGFYGQAQYYMGENLSNVANKKDGNGMGLRVGYANGPIDAALALSETKYLTGNIKAMNFGGAYDLGVAKLMAHYNQDKISNGAKGTGYLLGATVPMGAGLIRAAYSTYKIDNVTGNDPRSTKLALGYVHNLSKRTALYATYARVSNKGGATQALNGASTAANNSSNGYDFGVRHSF